MIRCRDLAEENATLEVRCRQCGRITLIPGSLLVRQHGANTAVALLVARMRCEKDGMPPDAVIVLNETTIAAAGEAIRRKGVSVHRPSRR